MAALYIPEGKSTFHMRSDTMKRTSRTLALAALGLSLMACGANKFYMLPADPYRISETQTYIGMCATQFGLESYKADNIQSVNVTYDDAASIYYQYNSGDHLNMQINVDDKKVPAAELQQKFAAVKARGDEIYSCAQTRLNPAPVVMMPAHQPYAAPSSNISVSMNVNANVNAHVNASASVSAQGSCAQAIECYAQMARTVCTQGASNCSFKVEISGNDEAACRDALLQVPHLMQPFTMMQPGLTAPAICRAE